MVRGQSLFIPLFYTLKFLKHMFRNPYLLSHTVTGKLMLLLSEITNLCAKLTLSCLPSLCAINSFSTIQVKEFKIGL